MKEAGIKSVLFNQVKDKRIIAFMILKGFGTFVIVTGLIGLSFILGPLNLIVKFEFTPMFGNTIYSAVFCFLLCVIGGALEFLADAYIKYLSHEKNE
jgi:putative Mn2+ efflux pump MntP